MLREASPKLYPLVSPSAPIVAISQGGARSAKQFVRNAAGEPGGVRPAGLVVVSATSVAVRAIAALSVVDPALVLFARVRTEAAKHAATAAPARRVAARDAHASRRETRHALSAAAKPGDVRPVGLDVVSAVGAKARAIAVLSVVAKEPAAPARARKKAATPAARAVPANRAAAGDAHVRHLKNRHARNAVAKQEVARPAASATGCAESARTLARPARRAKAQGHARHARAREVHVPLAAEAESVVPALARAACAASAARR